MRTTGVQMKGNMRAPTMRKRMPRVSIKLLKPMGLPDGPGRGMRHKAGDVVEVDSRIAAVLIKDKLAELASKADGGKGGKQGGGKPQTDRPPEKQGRG